MTRSTRGETREKKIELAIVVLTYGAGDEVLGLLSSLSRETIEVAHEIIVVHNPRHPGETLGVNVDDAHVVELSANSGYVGGMNEGITYALQRDLNYILLLTHDVRIAGEQVQRLREVMHEHPDLGAVGPVLSTADGQPYSAGFSRYGRARVRYRRPLAVMPKPIWPCAALDGSAMFWRATALRDVQGFDPRFFMYFDDVDICTRATRHGWEIAIASDLRAGTAPGGSQRRGAHAYLRARNGLACASSFGRSGLLAGLVDCLLGLWRATPKPGGNRFGSAEDRRIAGLYWRGTLLGVIDYFRGRWGPPPQNLLRDSDIAAT